MAAQKKMFSTERLLQFLALLDQEIILTIRPTRHGHKPGVRVLLQA